MLFGLRVLLRELLLPPGGLLLLGIAGLFLIKRRRRLGAVLCAGSLGSLWLLSTPWVADSLGRAAEGYPAVDPARLSAVQDGAGAIVILGGGFRREAPELGGVDAPSTAADLRLIEGARAARATHLPVLVTGSHREAVAMARFMRDTLEVPVRWVEDQSRTTRENADFSARILKPLGIDRVMLVTSGTHMIRAVADFRHAGFGVVPVPAGMTTRDQPGVLAFIPSAEALARSQTAFYEWAGRFVHLFV